MKKKSKRGPGRPLGSDEYKPEYAKLLIEHLANGDSYTTFAATPGVCVDTLYEWEKKHPDFSEAKRRGWPMYQKWWEDNGKRGMYHETFKDNDGMTVSRSINSAVYIYNMKCRFPRDWRDNQEVTATVTHTVSITDQVEEAKKEHKRISGLK